MIVRTFCLAAVAAVALGAVGATTVGAANVIIDSTAAGTVYDGILDGFPGIAAQDGTPDFGGNALAVALKAGVTEERAIVQFPLASLAGLSAADIVSATFTFNIDDVVGSFGPGANFDGTAAESFFVWAWDGNGIITLADFNKVAGAPAGSVSTTSFGTITDATLATTHALPLDVDVTAALKARLTNGATHMGLTLATLDENTATSIDDKGFGGTGAPGSNDSAMPFLTVVTAEEVTPPPTFAKSQRACQALIAQRAKLYGTLLHGKLLTCFNRVLKDVGNGAGTDAATIICTKALSPTSTAKVSIAKARAAAINAIAGGCHASLTPGALNFPCTASAESFGDVAACVLNAAGEQAQRTVRASFADSCSIATAVGLDADYPVLCADN